MPAPNETPEQIAAAQAWVDANFPASQTTAAQDPDVLYRRGFIDAEERDARKAQLTLAKEAE